MSTLSRPLEPQTPDFGSDHPSTAEIMETLRLILESHPFRTSKQCQDLLRHVVRFTLAGDDAALKERVIGAKVFGRQPAYDTNEDPVVRVRAAEVRKRLAQYYQSLEAHSTALHIELMPGSYRVHFRHHRPILAAHGAESVAKPEPEALPETGKGRNRYLASWTSRLIALALVAAAIIGVGLWIDRSWSTPLERFWSPIASAKQPALVYMGSNAVYVLSDDYLARYRASHGIANTGPEFFVDLPPDQSILANDLVPVKDTFVSVADSAAAVQVTTLLRDWKRPFVLRAGRDLSFGDLRNRPSVMIGGFNNSWALELTNDLPFHFREGVRIESRDHPDRGWTVPKNNHDSSTDDYALITRLLVSKSGGPVMAAAGIGQNGTQAAAEFLTNPDKMRSLLQSAPAGWEDKNSQVVLHVKVVGYLPVSVEIVDAAYW